MLKAGALSAGFDDTDERFAEIVSTTWERLRPSTKGGLRRLDGSSSRIHRVGPQAAALTSSGRLSLRDSSAQVYYKVRWRRHPRSGRDVGSAWPAWLRATGVQMLPHWTLVVSVEGNASTR